MNHIDTYTPSHLSTYSGEFLGSTDPKMAALYNDLEDMRTKIGQLNDNTMSLEAELFTLKTQLEESLKATKYFTDKMSDEMVDV